VAALTHGGVTTELVRTLLSDDAQPSRELDLDIAPCAVTTISGLYVIAIGSPRTFGRPHCDTGREPAPPKRQNRTCGQALALDVRAGDYPVSGVMSAPAALPDAQDWPGADFSVIM
jgi:hypothetical protein